MIDVNTLNFKLAHVGINTPNDEEAKKIANLICALFGVDLVDGGLGYFAGSIVEAMKSMGRGTNGHIGISTSNIYDAMEYIKSKGFEFDEDSKMFFPDESLKLIYIKGEIGGFAIHITQKR